MRKLLTALLIFTFLLVIILSGAAVAGYFYLKSDGFKTKVEETVSQNTTTPVTINSLGISLSGITMQGLEIPNDEPLSDNFLATREFELKLKWMSLLEEMPAIDAIRIGAPALILHQSAAGGMHLPLKDAGDGTGGQSTSTGIDLLLKELKIEEGRFQAYDPEGAQLLVIDGFNLSGDVRRISGDWKLASSLSTQSIVAGPYITVKDASSPLTMDKKIVSLPELYGTFYQGSLDGMSQVDLNPDDPTFSFALKGVGSDMDKMMQSFGKEAGFMQGSLNFELSGNGNASAPKNLSGKGNFSIAPAKMPKLQAARILGSILGIKLMQDGTFEQVKGTFTLNDQVVDFSQLEVISENVSVKLTGTVGFDTQLNLQGNIILEPGATDVFSKLFGQTADEIRSEVREVPLTITGLSSKPDVKVNTVQVGLDAGKSLLNRFLFNQDESEENPTDEPVEQVDSIIKGLFGN
ncbi:MAG: AsmA-like C-terminal region-containing protein [Verrucomicrobiota bacterium]